VARLRDPARASAWRAHALRLREAVEANAWDGRWYRRATYDDGTWMGAEGNAECRIDSIAQSWAVLCGVADPRRARMGMDSVLDHLVRRDPGLALLFTPPFAGGDKDPGYVAGYPPGVRENGGQYSHAAMWSILALARLGEGDKAHSLFALVNPIAHALTPDEAARYRVEPYVVAADVYSVAPHTGRGGWTWYTGSAGWMYRMITESLLGLRLTAGRLHFTPCLPSDWHAFRLRYRYGETVYHITVRQTSAAESGVAVSVDGVAQPEPTIPLIDDRREHHVEVRLQKKAVDVPEAVNA
jgi:cyclic beta-1,2-glucan synthetase